MYNKNQKENFKNSLAEQIVADLEGEGGLNTTIGRDREVLMTMEGEGGFITRRVWLHYSTGNVLELRPRVLECDKTFSLLWPFSR